MDDRTVRHDREEGAALPFRERFVEVFDRHFVRIRRALHRLAGDAELADDLVQEAFVRLYRRGALPDRPEAWLVTVALNLLRNERVSRARRARLLERAVEAATADAGSRSAADAPTEEEATRRRVRAALERLSERERALVVLRSEGYAYRDLAEALGLNEASVGVFLARARTAFRTAYEEERDAP